MKLNSLQDLFVKELKDVYNAERQLLRALPKMARAASTPEIQRAFSEHLEQTRRQVERLDNVFELINVPARGVHCKGMEGVIEEAEELLENGVEPMTLDAALISAAQKAEHYEIAAYGSMRTFAQQLGHDQAVRLLQETLDEEKKADRTLTDLAESMANPQAAHADGNGDGRVQDPSRTTGGRSGRARSSSRGSARESRGRKSR